MEKKTKDSRTIEEKLESFLRPVNPKEEFASNLKNRLLTEPEITIENSDNLSIIILVCSIFIFGVLFVWILFRFFSRNNDEY